MLDCKRCRQEKPLSDFYTSQRSYCKDCWKTVVKENRAKNAEKYRDYDRARNSMPNRVEARRAYAQTEVGKEKMLAARRRWQSQNVVKRAAHVILGNAVRDGRIDKPKVCQRCNTATESRKLHAHHADYALPLKVEWLCSGCHRQEHVK